VTKHDQASKGDVATGIMSYPRPLDL